ncbi:MAG: TlyA family RNA methyltransferase [Crocinitomicaceae bacterium]|jgi:23S rRNA (cytidine1920-2'-O)/16S rRNA (cytidine1409-2'-O)-methyltransferase|nr:TlyA family RNA methyltransferase [Crocinitomicaceae bacterium]MDP4761659.1 TlyA family RNA methyltransferase [Crocinitomicaceae bacterium]
MEEERIDKIIMERALVSSRVRAEELIRKFGVLVNGKLISKPGKKVPVDAEIELISEEIPWVSKGALKLVAAIDEWSFNCTDKVFIDLGASTGGFTEVLLSKGAKKVFGVDVGSNQMHERIKTDERVINLEKTHARDLTEKQITEEIDGLVVDVSFISLEKVIPFVIRFLKPNAEVVLLIKPQFELGRAFLSKGGIVKDVRQYPILLETIKSMCERNQLQWQAYIDSPILGGDGNKEFLGYFKRK